MSAEFQTIAALVVVALTAAWLIARVVGKRRNHGCGSDCGAVSPEMKRLQSKLKSR
jgi:hypothetical protein